jgi:hypothetical protein
MSDGASWYLYGDTPRRPVTEADVIDFLHGNVIELAQEGFLDEDRRRSNAGFPDWLDCGSIASTCCICRKNVVLEQARVRRTDRADQAGLSD